MNSIDEVVARNIKERRVKLGLTQKRLAEMAKLSPITVNKIETGARPAGKSTVVAIASAMGCSPEELYAVPGESLRASPDILEAIERGVAQTLARTTPRVASPTADYGLSPDKLRLIEIVRQLPDERVRTLLDVLDVDPSSVLADEKNPAPRKRR